MRVADFKLEGAPELPGFVRDVLLRLERELPSHLRYHTLQHTLDVIQDSLMLARSEKLSAKDLELLLIAAAFHDAGYLEGPHAHEKRSAALAHQQMTASGAYLPADIALVTQAIEDTEVLTAEAGISQTPRTGISPCLLDADLANLGKEEFFDKTELIRLEKNLPRSKAFYLSVEELLARHGWLSRTAGALWQKQKEENLRKLRALLQRM